MVRKKIRIWKLYYFLLLLVILFSCKTIIVYEEIPHESVPGDIKLINIPKGVYSSGAKKTEAILDYDYKIMEYPVTNLQYVKYLEKAFQDSLISVTKKGVSGFYQGDDNWPAGEYEYFDLDDLDNRIYYFEPDSFAITWHWTPIGKEYYNYHPVTEVTWFGANAFANYYGMRLPTKEEWEKAARANTGFNYPWGDSLKPEYANFKDSGDIYDNGTAPVYYYNGKNDNADSYSPYGVYDMVGNVWEWTNSWWKDSAGKVIKGGSWNSKGFDTLIPNGYYSYELVVGWETKVSFVPQNSLEDIGFRCVKD